jgi:hypothetical protein
MKITPEIAKRASEAAHNILNGRSTQEDREVIRKINNDGKSTKPKKDWHGLRVIEIGKDYKLRGKRSHINGRNALVVTVTDIMRANDARLDTYIATDGCREWCHLKRIDLIEL